MTLNNLFNNSPRLAWELLDRLTELVQVVRSDGSFLYANQSWFNLLGYSPKEIKTLKIWDLVHPAQRDQLEAVFEDVSPNYSPSLDIAFITKKGQPIMLAGQLHLNPQSSPQSEPTYSFILKASLPLTTTNKNPANPPEVLGIPGGFPGSPLKEKTAKSGWQKDFAEQMLGAMGQGLVVSDLGGHIYFVNPAFSRIINYSREEIMGRALADFHAPETEDGNSFIETERESQPGETFTYEVSLLNREGNVVYALITSTPYYLESYRVGTISVISNLTRRKEVEKELERERQFVTTILETAGSLITVLDDNGSIIRWNRTCADLSGWRPEEALGKPIWDLIFPTEGRAKAARQYAALIKAHIPRIFENDLLTRSGETHIISWSTTQAFDNSGNTRFLIGIGIDVTAQRKAEDALRKNERRYRALTEAAFEGIFLSENDFVVDANQAATRLYGYSLAEFRKLRPVELVSPEDQEIVAANIRAGFETSYEVRGKRKDGSYFPIEIRGKTEVSPQHTIRATAVRDLTTRKEAEAQQELLFNQLINSLGRLQALYDSTMALVGSSSLSEVMQTVADGAVRSLNAHRVSVILIDTEAEKVLATYKSGAGADLVEAVSYSELNDGLTGWVLLNLRAANSSKNCVDPRESPLVRQRRLDTNCGAIMVAPLLYHDRVLGTITAINTPEVADFSAPDLELLTVLAGQAASAINAAQLLAETRHQAQTDGLTGLLNRRAFFEGGETQLKQAKEKGLTAALILLDVDHFKQVNDVYGHLSGDEALRVVAKCCQAVCGEKSLVGRYGGEEFVLLLPAQKDIGERAHQVAEHLRATIAETPVVLNSPTKKGDLHLTVSLGVAVLAVNEESLEKLVARADVALYKAKEAGRNCVVVADHP